MSALIGGIVSVAVLLLFAGVRRVRAPGFEAQLAPFGNIVGELGPRTRYHRWVRPLAVRLAGFGLLRGFFNGEKVSRQLDYAGNPAGITADEFYGIQIYGLCAGLLMSVIWFALGLPFGQFILVLLPVGGFIYPQLWLRGKVRSRQHAITVALPDMLDMLAVCVSAGMGFDIALNLLTERGDGPLYEELERLLRELAIGEPREQAFRHMALRNSSEALRSFVDALLQAEDLGTPIAASLERQAEDLRTARRQRARAEGAKASTKISLVVTILIMPSVLCLVIGALAITIAKSAGQLPSPTP